VRGSVEEAFVAGTTFADRAPIGGAGRRGVSDGIRTRDRLDHNQELYLLSYAHHGELCAPPRI
jgi:hypothetical protein